MALTKKGKTSVAIILITVFSVALSSVFLKEVYKANSTIYTVKFVTGSGVGDFQIKAESGSTISKPNDPIKNGYSLESWIFSGRVWDFKNDVVTENITLYASWSLCHYTISYETNGGSLPEVFPTEYTIESNFNIGKPIKDLNIFTGWFSQSGDRIDSIKPGMTGDLKLSAHWVDNLIIQSLDPMKGTYDVFVDPSDSNKFTVENIPVNGKYHTFAGYFDENNNLLSKHQIYTFKLEANKQKYIYLKYQTDEEEADWNESHGVTPQLLSSDDTILYGMYPQSNVNDEGLLSELDMCDELLENGYCCFDHEYYIQKKVKIIKNSSGEPLAPHQFDNGSEMINDELAWFKVEPIKWNILKNNAPNYCVYSQKLLDVKTYQNKSAPTIIDDKTIYPNNYQYSSVREWLNGSFYNVAFQFDNTHLLEMEIDNSAETLNIPDENLVCENTFDNVTLLSYKEYFNIKQTNRRFKTTDYSRSSKANYGTEEVNLYSGYCWSRSPFSAETNYGTAVSRNNKNGTLNNDYVGSSQSCVQPVITVKFS